MVYLEQLVGEGILRMFMMTLVAAVTYSALTLFVILPLYVMLPVVVHIPWEAMLEGVLWKILLGILIFLLAMSSIVIAAMGYFGIMHFGASSIMVGMLLGILVSRAEYAGWKQGLVYLVAALLSSLPSILWLYRFPLLDGELTTPVGIYLPALIFFALGLVVTHRLRRKARCLRALPP